MSIRKSAYQQAILSVGAGLLTGLLGTTILFKDLIFAGTSSVLWADKFDSRLEYWIANWGYHILFEEKDPLRFWNANSFFPNRLTLAYSDSLLGMQVLFSPLRMLGISPLTSLYMALAGVCIIGATFTQYALYRMGYFSLIERILITFSAHFSLSVISFLGHYQLFGFQLAAPFFLFLYLFLQELKQSYLVILVILFVIGISFAMYLAPMLFVLSILMCIPIIIKQIRRLGFQQLFQKIGFRGIGIVVISMLILYFVQIRPYLKIAGSFPKQSFEETALYSADLTSVFTGFSIFSFWYSPIEYPAYGAWEYAYFPGFILLILSLPYLIYAVSNIVKKHFISEKKSWHPDRTQHLQEDSSGVSADFILYMAILFTSSVILSWGPYYKPDHSVQLPFYYLSKLTFGLRDVRAPGRFGMLISVPLAVFAVTFLRIFVISIKTRHWITILVTFLIIIEAFPAFPVYPFSIDSEGIYKQICQVMEPGSPLLELPVFGKDIFETTRIAMDQLDGSTIHWGRLVVGYGAKTTAEYTALLNIDHKIQQEMASPATAIRFGKRYGISYFLIHINRYSPTVVQKWKNVVRKLDGQVLFETQDVIFLNLNSGHAQNTIKVMHYSCMP